LAGKALSQLRPCRDLSASLTRSLLQTSQRS
jgi:hypothetical protein